MDKSERGKKGGAARAAKLSPKVRAEIASLAANTRWNNMNKPIDDRDDMLIMTLKLASGKFESTVSVPLMASEEEKQNFSNAWFDLMIAGVKCSGSARDNKAKTFTNAEKLADALKEAHKRFNEAELEDPVLLAGFLMDHLTRNAT